MKLPIYLDYSATTPVDPRVAQKMIPYLTEIFGNPASRSHAFGWKAEEGVEEARGHVAALINADPKEIVWTSGATEGNNLAIKGAAQFYKTKGKHLITQKTEHKAVLDTFRELERQGFEATYLEVEPNGLVDIAKFKAAIRPDTILTSIMMVNNEIGVIQPVWEIADICKAKGIIFHCDAVQGAGRVPIDMNKLRADLILEDEIRRPAFKRVDDFFRPGSLRDEDERNFRPLLLHDAQGGESVEARQAVIRENQVGRIVLQFADEDIL